MQENKAEFVVHCHQNGDDVHWDLMLKVGDKLETWQLSVDPQNWLEKPIPAKKISDHRLKYLTYQGPISNNRGHCSIVLTGWYWQISSSGQPRILILQTLRGFWQLNLPDNGQDGFMVFSEVQKTT